MNDHAVGSTDASPRPTLSPPEVPDTYIPGGRRVPALNAGEWYRKGLAMFFQAPGGWLVISLLYLVANYLTGGILIPVLSGGAMIAAERQVQNGRLEISDLFAGFTRNTGQLLLLIVVILLYALVALAYLGVIAIPTILAWQFTSVPRPIIVTTFVILYVPLLLFRIASDTAPALVALHSVGSFAAMNSCLLGVAKNCRAIAVSLIIFMGLLAACIVTLGLGLFVVIPLSFPLLYFTYRDIFVAGNGPKIPETPPAELPRQWTHAKTGDWTMATLGEHTGTTVTLRKEDGSELNIPVDELSAEDRQFIDATETPEAKQEEGAEPRD